MAIGPVQTPNLRDLNPLGPVPARPAATPAAPEVPADRIEVTPQRSRPAKPADAPPPPAEAPAAPPPERTAVASPLQGQVKVNGGTGVFSANGALAVFETPEAATPSRPDPKFVSKYGPWAIVTGASGGIGSEFARQLAAKGMNVVLVARSVDKMKHLAEELREQQGVQVKVVGADLSDPNFMEGIKSGTQDLDVGLLINNAGSWEFGQFLEHDPNRELNVIRTNVEAPMLMCHEFGKRFAERGQGGILNVGSGAALHGVPGQANYSATKGYLMNLTESLHHELKPHGVDVMITNPGPVIGEASSAYDQSKVPLQKVTAGEVVEHSLDKLGKKCSTIPGWFNRLAMFVALRVLPRDVNAAIAGHLLEKASGH